MKINRTLVITGTHHTPAIEIIKQLQKDPQINWSIFYFGQNSDSVTHISQTIIPKLGIKFYDIPCGKYNRRWLPDTIFGLPSILTGFFKSFSLLRQLKPDLVLSFGGYVSVPVIAAAKILNIPSITHEQTLTVGLATKINSFFVNKIALSFPETKNIQSLPVKKLTVTGNPIRSEIFQNNSAKFKALELKLIKSPLIYVTGGNQGSKFINDLTINVLPRLSGFTVIHQTGQINFKHVLAQTGSRHFDNYYPVEYVNLEDIGWILNHADIVIGRAGANTCQELFTLGKKAILIPLPFSQQNEQLLNARWLKTNQPKITVIFSQTEATPANLLQAVNSLHRLRSTTVSSTNNTALPLIKLIHEMA